MRSPVVASQIPAASADQLSIRSIDVDFTEGGSRGVPDRGLLSDLESEQNGGLFQV